MNKTTKVKEKYLLDYFTLKPTKLILFKII